MCSVARNFSAGVYISDAACAASCALRNSISPRHLEHCPAAAGRGASLKNVPAVPASAAPPQDLFGDDERSCGGGGAVEEESTRDNRRMCEENVVFN